MNRRFVTRAVHALALLWVALQLAGCGGGTTDGSDATVEATEATDDYYVWNVVSSNWGSWHWLAVVDPARPGSPKHSILTTTADGSPAWPRGVSGTRLDPAGQRITLLGTTRLFYLQQGRVYTLDLAIHKDAAPARLSNITDACWIWQTHALDATGEDTWAVIETAGADGRCDHYFDNAYAAVRTNMRANSPAMPLPDSLRGTVFVLPDEHGRALGLLVHAAGRLRLYDTDLATSTEVADGGSFTGLWPMALFAGERKLYLSVWANGSSTGSVRVLSYSAGAASLGSEVMTLDSPLASAERGDWNTYYFADGSKLYRLTADGPAPLASFAAGEVRQITPTANHVVARLRDPASSAWSTWSVPKAGGAPIDLATPERDVDGGTENFVHWGTVAGDRYFFFSEDAQGLGSIYSVDAGGHNAQTWASGVAYAGALYRRSPARGQWWEQITDVVYCEPQAGHTGCDGGTMKQLDVTTQAATTLGSLPRSGKASRAVQYTFAWGLSGGPFGIGTQLYDSDAGSSAYDLFIATAGVADSLRAATYNYAAP